MGVTLNTNMSAIAAYNNLRKTQTRADVSLERLSSGLRINRAADDAAGLAISEKLRTQVNGLTQAQRNAQDGVSLMQTADGGLTETHALLQRMRTLAVQASNKGVLSRQDLQAIQREMDQLTAEIDQVADGNQFNGMPLLDGGFTEKRLQIGANAGDSMEVTIATSRVAPIPPTQASFALWNVDKALDGTRGAMPDPFIISNTLGDGTTVEYTVPTPLPESVSDLVDLINGDPQFSSSFEARAGNIRLADGTERPSANLIVTAKEPGAGRVTVSAEVPLESRQSRDTGYTALTAIDDRYATLFGKAFVGDSARPGQYGGFHARELLFAQIDVLRTGGTSTTTVVIPPSTYSVGGGYEDFGDASYSPPVTVSNPGGEVTYTSTATDGAQDAIDMIDRAIALVSKGRAEIGAYQNRLEHATTNLTISAENMAAAESRIRDADMAKEMTELSKSQILAQAGVSMLAQANQAPQSLLRLLPNT